MDPDAIVKPFIADLEGIMEPAEAALQVMDDLPAIDTGHIAADQLEALIGAWTESM